VGTTARKARATELQNLRASEVEGQRSELQSLRSQRKDGGRQMMVPYIEEDDVIFLKTVFPSRKYTKIYLHKESE
jgi:hypothetical protein